MTNKKSEGLPINVLVIATLSLAVLIVLFFMFTESSANFAKTTLTCESKGGRCIPAKDCVYEKAAFQCKNKDDICCINPLNPSGSP